MNVINKVKDELEKTKQFDFSSEFWTGEKLSLLYDIVNATETVVKNNVVLPDVIDSFIIKKPVIYNNKDYKVYNVKLMLEPEDDSQFENIYYDKLRKENK